MWVDKISKHFSLARRDRPERDRAETDPIDAGAAPTVYPTWQAARAASKGYDADVILQRVRASAHAVRRGEAAFERDSVRFVAPQYRWQMLACVASAAAARGGHLHVADFGGSLGSVYFQHRPFFSTWPALMWSIVEQAHFVACGRAEFEDETLRFYERLEEAQDRAPVDLVLFSSSLQYVPDPDIFLNGAMDLSPRTIIIDRTPFIAGDHDTIIVEDVPEEIFPASYPLRLLAEEKLKAVLAARGYDEAARYVDGIDPDGYVGLVFRRG